MSERGESVTIGRFLISLAENPGLVEEFLKNPERVMRDAGVSREDRDLIHAGKTEEITSAVREEFAEAQVAFIVHPSIVHP